MFAIFIACLGLFRLVTYGSKHRTREIGIGKVLGATANGVVAMLSKDFAWLVAFASLIAFPISWWDYEKLVAKFCLQDRYKLMGIRSCASCCAADYPVDCWLAGDKGRDCKSGEELRTE